MSKQNPANKNPNARRTRANAPTRSRMGRSPRSRAKDVAAASGSHAYSNTLARYMNEMGEHDMLTPQQEIELAQQIEELQREGWRMLLAERAALEPVARVVKRHLDEPPRQLATLQRLARASSGRVLRKNEKERWAKHADALAEALRAADPDRLLAKRARRALRRHQQEQNKLTTRQRKALAEQLRHVDRVGNAEQNAKDRFVTANLRLVISMARRFSHGTMPLEDLIQEGNFGLLKAVDRFDYRRGFRFSTYAGWWIRHYVTRAIADKGRLVRIPVHLLDAHQRVARTRRQTAAKSGHEPTLEEVGEELGLSEDKVSMLKDAHPELTPFSLDATVGEAGEDKRFVDLLEDEESLGPDEELQVRASAETVHTLMEAVTPMEADILRWRFGLADTEELSLRQIGEKYGLSRERIRQIQVQALDKMRSFQQERENARGRRPALEPEAA